MLVFLFAVDMFWLLLTCFCVHPVEWLHVVNLRRRKTQLTKTHQLLETQDPRTQPKPPTATHNLQYQNSKRLITHTHTPHIFKITRTQK